MSDEDSTSGRLLWAVIGMQKRNLLGADAHALVNNCTRAWEQYNNASGKLTDVVSPTQKSVSTKGRKPKTTTLHLQPSGKPTAAGGIFKRNATLDQPYVDPQLSVWYMVLSAYLAEFNTGDRRYRDAAIQSAHYILDHMLDPATGLIKDVYINAVTGQQVDGATLSCHLTGWVIQGLSVLAHVTYWEDQSWGTKAIEIAMAAMFYGEWHSPDGILTVGTDEDPLKDSDVKRYKGILNYGLLVAYKRNPSNKPFRDLVRSYINVQFNALYELARHGNYYAIDWRGPNIERKFHSQLAALTTMVSALTVNIDDEGDDQIDYNRDPW